MTSKPAAKYLNISLQTLYNWVSAKKIPYENRGGGKGRLIFLKKDLDEFNKKNKIKAIKKKLKK